MTNGRSVAPRWLTFRLAAVGAVVTAAAVLAGVSARVPSAAADGPNEKGGRRERLDKPGEAARFRATMVAGGDKDGRPLDVPATAMPKAIEKMKALRGATAARFKMQAAAMQAEAAVGQLKTVAGVPVGPLAGTYAPAGGGARKFVPHAAALSTTANLNPSGWQWIGPGNIGGRTRAIAVHPTDPNVVWVGGVAGGVWKSTDAGASWAPMTDFMANIAVTSLAVHPADANTLYAGTGEGFGNIDATRGFGLFTSTDGGLTWAQMPATAGAAAPDFRYVNRIAVSKDGDAVVLMAATNTGLFRSTDAGASFTKVGGVLAGQPMRDVKVSATNPKNFAAATDGAVFSTSDGGATWTKATGISGGRIEVTYARADANTIYASADQNQGTVYRSTNNGATFTFRGNPQHLSNQGWYANCLWAGDPTDVNLVVVGGLNLHRSSNGGVSFAVISDWTQKPNSPHADHHVIVSHPLYNGTTNKSVYFGNDGGVYRAADVRTAAGTTGWESLNHGLGLTQFYGIAVNPASGKVVGGAQDNGTIIRATSGGTESWKEIFGGDGGFCAADPTAEVYYGEYVNMNIHRGNGVSDSVFITGDGDSGLDDPSPLFISPFILDPNQPKWLLCGGSALYRTKNADTGGPSSFATIKDGVPGNSISAIAVAKGNSKLVWVGYARSAGVSGRVHRTTGAQTGNSWQPALAGLPDRYVSRIVIDPTNTDRVYALFTGYESDNLFKTEDGGATWATLGAATLPEVPFFDLAIHPDNPKFLYLGTEIGLFVSDDGGANWNPTNQGPTNAPAQNLVWRGKTLYAGTHGRGIFTIDLTLPPPGGAGAAPVPAKVDAPPGTSAAIP